MKSRPRKGVIWGATRASILTATKEDLVEFHAKIAEALHAINGQTGVLESHLENSYMHKDPVNTPVNSHNRAPSRFKPAPKQPQTATADEFSLGPGANDFVSHNKQPMYAPPPPMNPIMSSKTVNKLNQDIGKQIEKLRMIQEPLAQETQYTLESLDNHAEELRSLRQTIEELKEIIRATDSTNSNVTATGLGYEADAANKHEVRARLPKRPANYEFATPQRPTRTVQSPSNNNKNTTVAGLTEGAPKLGAAAATAGTRLAYGVEMQVERR